MNQNYEFINYLPGLVIAKDEHSKYINISDSFAKLLGFKSAQNILGKTDYDIPSSASSFASDFIAMDKTVLKTRKKMLTLDIQPYSGGQALILAERNYLQNNDKDNLLNYCLNVSSSSLFQYYVDLHLYDSLQFGTRTKPASYILSDSHCPLSLTTKQQEVLFYLIRGKSIKQVAATLSLSPRTIETHLELIKNKFNCHTKNQIIEYALDRCYLFYIPKAMQK